MGPKAKVPPPLGVPLLQPKTCFKKSRFEQQVFDSSKPQKDFAEAINKTTAGS
jgi:hypothetical protein